ncbi:MAG: energy transducer TonB [Pyrinomonadaceae bacterium]|nr:energy transducer TonB [Pyrinomonadaceae bacterium]
MKRSSLLFFIWIFLFSLSNFAQTESADWQIFQPPTDEYSIELPVTATLIFADKQENNYRFSAKFDGRFFFIFSENIKAKSPDKTLQKFIDYINTKPVESQMNGLKVEKYSFKSPDGYFHNLWLVNTKNKIYAFHSASEIEKDEVVERVLKSISFDGKARKIKRVESRPAETEQDAGTSNDNAVSNSGTGSGRGIPPKLPANESTLRILSKPRAKYTDFARFFDTQGTVRLRVTFLSTGEIGAVEVVKKLPFGLTAQAVEAARLMRFEPYKRDDKPINTAKLVEYIFTIY